MTKPHPVYAQFQGKKAYGIRRIAVISPRLHTAVGKCDVASKSADARDKAPWLTEVSLTDGVSGGG